MISPRTIQILVSATEASNVKEAFGRPTTLSTEVANVSPETLSRNIAEFLARFEPVINNEPELGPKFQIDEYELSLSINAEGGVSLIGQMKAGATASIKVKIKRKPD